MTSTLTADEISPAEAEREADVARWAAMLARGRVLQPLMEAMLAVPGATTADVARTLRTWADIIDGHAQAAVQIEDIPAA